MIRRTSVENAKNGITCSHFLSSGRGDGRVFLTPLRGQMHTHLRFEPKRALVELLRCVVVVNSRRQFPPRGEPQSIYSSETIPALTHCYYWLVSCTSDCFVYLSSSSCGIGMPVDLEISSASSLLVYTTGCRSTSIDASGNTEGR